MWPCIGFARNRAEAQESAARTLAANSALATETTVIFEAIEEKNPEALKPLLAEARAQLLARDRVIAQLSSKPRVADFVSSNAAAEGADGEDDASDTQSVASEAMSMAESVAGSGKAQSNKAKFEKIKLEKNALRAELLKAKKEIAQLQLRCGGTLLGAARACDVYASHGSCSFVARRTVQPTDQPRDLYL